MVRKLKGQWHWEAGEIDKGGERNPSWRAEIRNPGIAQEEREQERDETIYSAEKNCYY